MPTAVSADPTTVANRLRPALLRLNRELRREIHSLGVTGGQVSLLIKIQRSPAIGIRELAERERCRARDVEVRRAARGCRSCSQRTRARDRRRVGLELTTEGARVLASVKRRRTAWLAERLARLSPEELDAVDAAVDRAQAARGASVTALLLAAARAHS